MRLIAEELLSLSRDSGIVAGEPGRHSRGKRFGARERVRRLDFGLLSFFAEYPAEQAFSHVLLPWLQKDTPQVLQDWQPTSPWRGK